MERSQQQKETLKQVRETLLKYLKGKPVQVYLFGSWAKQKNRHTSDIDIAIWSETNLLEKDIMGLRFHLEESSIPYRVDVVDLTKAEPEFLKKVKEEGLLWIDYEKD